VPDLKLPIRSPRATTWLLTTYLDETLRISRGDAGSIFVVTKEPSNDMPTKVEPAVTEAPEDVADDVTATAIQDATDEAVLAFEAAAEGQGFSAEKDLSDVAAEGQGFDMDEPVADSSPAPKKPEKSAPKKSGKQGKTDA
jgi:PAP_fibrillin